MPEAPALLPRAITRRQGLRALALIGPIGMLAACSDDSSPLPGPSGTPTAGPAPGEASAAEESELIARYDTVIEAFPEASAEVLGVLRTIRDQHSEHRDALGGADAQSDQSSVPAGIDEALSQLIAAERKAGKSRVRACVAAENPETARLLALIGASESAHVPALRDLRA
jgi:hypothetical protein